MNGDLELDEMRAAAMPEDWPADFGQPHGHDRTICMECGHPFIGLRSRIECRVCSRKREWFE